jgi:hypothetical protein
LAVHVVIPNRGFIAEFLRQKRTTPMGNEPVMCKTAKCGCDAFELDALFDVTVETGVCRCLKCGLVVRLAEVMPIGAMTKKDRQDPSRISSGGLVPIPLPAKRLPQMDGEPPKIYTEYTPIQAAPDTQEDQEFRKALGMFLGSRMRIVKETHNLAHLFRVEEPGETREAVEYKEPEELEQYLSEIADLES